MPNPPSQEWIDRYDRIYVGSPLWWHQPAMVVCTFLETYDLSGHTIIPFFTYGATTYLNEGMQKIYRCTPNSVHIPATLPEDLDADDITRPGRPDDSGIDMPENASGVEGWLTRLGLLGGSGVADTVRDPAAGVSILTYGSEIRIRLDDSLLPNTVEIYNIGGSLLSRMSGRTEYAFTVPTKAVYLLSMVCGKERRHINKKLVM